MCHNWSAWSASLQKRRVRAAELRAVSDPTGPPLGGDEQFGHKAWFSLTTQAQTQT